jgi:tetratricopeptide (TPR) repeat protein
MVGNTRRNVARLDLERDNLLLALAWAPATDDAIPGLRLAAAMHDYWFLRAAPALGLQVTRAALGRPGAQGRSLERCRALVTAGWMCTLAGHDAEAVQTMDEALSLARELADGTSLCFALAKFAHVRHHRHETNEALRLVCEALDVGRNLGDCVELGDALNLRAHVHRSCGERDCARSLFNEALALRQRLDIPSGIFSVCQNLAFMAVEDGLVDEAKHQLDEALALLTRADSQSGGIHLIGLTAQWAAIAGLPDVSVLLEAACDKLLDRSGMRNQLDPSEVVRLERARRALDVTACQKLETQGRALSYELALRAVADCLGGAASICRAGLSTSSGTHRE